MTGKQEQGTTHDHLVEQGIQKIRWAELHQRLLQRLREQFSETKPFSGLTIGICLHVEPKTAVLCSVLQAGGGKWEIDIPELRRRATAAECLREWVELFTLEDGRRITLLAQGEMLNLAGGGGNPIETMDLGLALQAQSLAYLVAHHRDLPPGPQPVPGEINATIAHWMVEHLSRWHST